MEKKKEQVKGILVATRPILYEGREFKTGEELPRYDLDMVDAWLKYGSAKILPGEPEEPKKPENPGEDEQGKEAPGEESQEDKQPGAENPDVNKTAKDKKAAGKGKAKG